MRSPSQWRRDDPVSNQSALSPIEIVLAKLYRAGQLDFDEASRVTTF